MSNVDPIGTVRMERHDNGGYSLWIKVDLPLSGWRWLCVQSTAPENVMQMRPGNSKDVNDYQPIVVLGSIRNPDC